MVVGVNERVICIDKNDTRKTAAIAKPLFFASENNAYYLSDYCTAAQNVSPVAESGSLSDDNASTKILTCDRDANNRADQIWRHGFVNLTALNAAENWIGGKVELKCYVIYSDNNSPTNTQGSIITKAFTGSRSTYKSGSSTIWVSSQAPIITWDPLTQGSTMLYQWIEEDAGGNGNQLPISISVGYSPVDEPAYFVSLSTVITFDNNDEDCASGEVSYCDATGIAPSTTRVYNTGIVKWIHNLQ